MEPGPAFYPDGELTDEPETVLMAEFIREAALEGVHDELPHSLAVVIEEIIERERRDDQIPMVDVHAILYVERDSQKGIIIGKQGARLKEVGTVAREADRAAARRQGLPRSPRQGGQGLAARSETVGSLGFLTAWFRVRRTETGNGKVELAV